MADQLTASAPHNNSKCIDASVAKVEDRQAGVVHHKYEAIKQEHLPEGYNPTGVLPITVSTHALHEVAVVRSLWII